MKITRRQLRRIIKEEKAKLMEARPRPQYRPGQSLDPEVESALDDIRALDPDPVRQHHEASVALGKLHQAIDGLISALGSEEARLELQGIVEDWQ